MIIVGRFIAGVGAGQLTMLAPLFQSEVNTFMRLTLSTLLNGVFLAVPDCASFYSRASHYSPTIVLGYWGFDC